MTRIAFATFALFVFAAACGSSPPPVRYYQIAVPEAKPAGQGEGILAVERIRADAAYDDARIVYRESPHRLDYYHYHRWSSPPGMMLSDYLRVAYDQSGHFGSVVSGFSDDADAILGGRLMAFEEVNETEDRWLARVRLELRLRDAKTGELLWSSVITETEPLEEHEPEGLAKALGVAMDRIVAATGPDLRDALGDRE